MTSIEEQILSYPHASKADREHVDAYVEAHPEWKPLLRDVQSLERLADCASIFETNVTGDRVLAQYAVARHLDYTPQALDGAFARLDAQLADDPDLQRRLDAMLERMRRAEEAVSPLAHLEKVTGHRIDDASPPSSTSDADAPTNGNSAPPQDRAPSDNALSPRSSSGDRDARPSSSPSLTARFSTRRAFITLLALAVVYGSLAVASWSSQSDMQRLAAVHLNEDVVRTYDVRTRSVEPMQEAESIDDFYLNTLPLLEDARMSTLGLFPRYDADLLAEAETRLQRVVDETDRGSFLQLEAYFYLGKVNLAQSDLDAARRYFKIVVQNEGRRTQEAVTILTELQESYPTQPQS